MSRIVSFRTGTDCPGQGYNRSLPLCSAKTMWEARTREEWEMERAFYEAGRIRGELWNLGALVDAHQQPHDPLKASLLDDWNASIDALGTLMNICVSLI